MIRKLIFLISALVVTNGYADQKPNQSAFISVIGGDDLNTNYINFENEVKNLAAVVSPGTQKSYYIGPASESGYVAYTGDGQIKRDKENNPVLTSGTIPNALQLTKTNLIVDVDRSLQKGDTTLHLNDHGGTNGTWLRSGENLSWMDLHTLAIKNPQSKFRVIAHHCYSGGVIANPDFAGYWGRKDLILSSYPPNFCGVSTSTEAEIGYSGAPSPEELEKEKPLSLSKWHDRSFAGRVDSLPMSTSKYMILDLAGSYCEPLRGRSCPRPASAYVNLQSINTQIQPICQTYRKAKALLQYKGLKRSLEDYKTSQLNFEANTKLLDKVLTDPVSRQAHKDLMGAVERSRKSQTPENLAARDAAMAKWDAMVKIEQENPEVLAAVDFSIKAAERELGIDKVEFKHELRLYKFEVAYEDLERMLAEKLKKDNETAVLKRIEEIKECENSTF